MGTLLIVLLAAVGAIVGAVVLWFFSALAYQDYRWYRERPYVRPGRKKKDDSHPSNREEAS